jgi:hypothetical protein
MKSPVAEVCKTIFIIYIIMFYSCSPNLYIPNTQHVPGFTHRGQTKLTASVVLNPDKDVKGGDVQLAHSIGDRTALLFHATRYYGHNGKGFSGFPFRDDGYKLGGSGHAVELGYGYYKSHHPRVVAELYGFGGLAWFSNNVHIGDFMGGFNGRFTRLAIQPSITFKTKYIETAISSRINHLHYFHIRGQYEPYDVLLKDTPDNFFFEPAITLSLGLKKVKLQLQYQYSYRLNSNRIFEQGGAVQYPFTRMNFTAGLKLDL